MEIIRQDADWVRLVKIKDFANVFGTVIETKPIYGIEVRVGFFFRKWKKVYFGPFSPDADLGFSNFTVYPVIHKLYDDCLKWGFKKVKQGVKKKKN